MTDTNAEAPTGVYLTTRHTDAFGPAGRFVEVPEAEATPHGDALAVPTAEQLALR